jgi:hypothetical protein
MRIEVVVPLCRSFVLAPMLRSFAKQTVRPDVVTLVTNWDSAKMEATVKEALAKEQVELRVRQLCFATDVYAWGMSDAGLRRNMAAWNSDEEAMLLWDDDQVPSRDTIEASLDLFRLGPWVFGHHRFVDFDAVPLDELLDWPPERGVSREKPANSFHTYHSTYGGNVAVLRKAYIDLGGYDLIYTRGCDDINIGRRVIGDNHVIVREPPLAWHPKSKLGMDMLMSGNICRNHMTSNARVSMEGMVIKNGLRPPPYPERKSWAYAACTKCPWVEPNPADPDEIVHWQGPVLRYDPKNVSITYVDLS